MLEHYHAVEQYCSSKDVQIINATVGGMLEVFPRVDYMDVFSS